MEQDTGLEAGLRRPQGSSCLTQGKGSVTVASAPGLTPGSSGVSAFCLIRSPDSHLREEKVVLFVLYHCVVDQVVLFKGIIKNKQSNP